MMNFNPVEILQLKKRGLELSKDQLSKFITAYLGDEIKDDQMAAFLMAVYFQGMSDGEIFTLTELLRDSGETLDFSSLGLCVDKHSTGGVGDKTSLILAPLVAAAGVPVPMMAGRGLGHTGGTLDKLESLIGFRVNLSLEEFRDNISRLGFSIMGQTKEICPADRRLYALRDITATVDSLPLICASIMSKKLAEGIQALVLDVKFGSGAFMKTRAKALELAGYLKKIGSACGVKTSTFLSSMDQPLGVYCGNALEVKECIEIMQGKTRPTPHCEDGYGDTRELTLQLAAKMIFLGGKAGNLQSGYQRAEEILSSGKALENFYRMCDAQGGAKPDSLNFSAQVEVLKASEAGFISAMDVESIGMAALELGAGRKRQTDKLDHSVGIEFLAKVGAQVSAGDELCRIHYNKDFALPFVKKRLTESIAITDRAPTPLNFIEEVE